MYILLYLIVLKFELINNEFFNLKVKPESTFEVNMPISPVIERGSIVIQIRALSQIAKQNLEIPLEILVKI